MPMKITIEGISVSFHTGAEALRDVSFQVASGEPLTVIGPSGCGKSTLLSAIASRLSPEEAEVRGRILVDGVDIRQGGIRGSLGYVFERDTLFPWRTVLQNVVAGLEIRGMPRADRLATARRLIDMVGLTGLTERRLRRPRQSLPGGPRETLVAVGGTPRDRSVLR